MHNIALLRDKTFPAKAEPGQVHHHDTDRKPAEENKQRTAINKQEKDVEKITVAMNGGGQSPIPVTPPKPVAGVDVASAGVENPIPLRRIAGSFPLKADKPPPGFASEIETMQANDQATQAAIPMSGATAPRVLSKLGQQITAGIDPLLEHAQHMNKLTFNTESLNEMEPSARRVQNTFNVSVSLEHGASSSLEQGILEDIVLEMLRTAARRQGLEV